MIRAIGPMTHQGPTRESCGNPRERVRLRRGLLMNAKRHCSLALGVCVAAAFLTVGTVRGGAAQPSVGGESSQRDSSDSTVPGLREPYTGGGLHERLRAALDADSRMILADRVSVLQEIRRLGESSTRSELEEFVRRMDRRQRSYRRVVDPMATLYQEARAAILLFDLKDRGVATVRARSAHLLEEINRRTAERVGTCNPEVILLQDDATALTDTLLAVAQSGRSAAVRVLVLRALEASRAPDLEPRVLSALRSDRVGDRATYSGFLRVLGAVGGQESVEYLNALLGDDDGVKRRAAEEALRKLARDATRVEVRRAAESALRRGSTGSER